MNRPLSANHVAIRATFAIVIWIGATTAAKAVPVFARKYQTSCQTCHIVFPKLNPFGRRSA